MTLRPSVLTAAVLTFAALSFVPAHAVDLIAIGKLPGTLRDLSGQSALLENGVPGDLLGGLGSGLAWAGGNIFLALPDRGPNAMPWNPLVDDTASYIPRFHTLQMDLAPVADPSTGLPFTLTPALLGTTLLYSRSPLNYGTPLAGYAAEPSANGRARYHFSGRSDNFDPATSSSDPRDARFDPEGIRLSANARQMFISDEYGPYIHVFDRATGARLHSVALPAKLAVAHKSSSGAAEIAGNLTGRVANKGMEGPAISPDGHVLFGFMQSPLIQDGGDGGRANRIVRVDLETEEVREFAYDNWAADKAKAYNSSELLALNAHELLVLERDGKGLGDGSKAVVKRVYKVDLAAAEDVSALSGEAALLTKAVPKTLFLDIAAKLLAAGIAAEQIPAKLEGMAFGDDVVVGGVVKHTLYVANDNDFLPVAPGGRSNPNQWFVFAFDDADLGGSAFRNQQLRSDALR